MSDRSDLFPKRARETTDQVEVHHEVLTRHARKFVDHADWITTVHQRVTAFEGKDPSRELQEFRTQFQVAIGKVQAAMWIFGIVWTLIVVIGIVVAVVAVVITRR